MALDLKTNKEGKIAAQKKLVFGQILPYFFLLLLFLTLFKGLFAPTSQSQMFKLFRFLESLGKSNGKKWSQIWKLLLIKGVKCKIAAAKKVFNGFVFKGSLRLNVFLPTLPKVQTFKIFRILGEK